jgi:flavoprotein
MLEDKFTIAYDQMLLEQTQANTELATLITECYQLIEAVEPSRHEGLVKDFVDKHTAEMNKMQGLHDRIHKALGGTEVSSESKKKGEAAKAALQARMKAKQAEHEKTLALHTARRKEQVA